MLAFAPELGMYAIWGLIDPKDFWEKAATIFIFGFFGAGFTLVVKFFMVKLWAHFMDAF